MKVSLLLVLASATIAAQDQPGRKSPSVIMAPAVITVYRSKPGTVDLHFRIGQGFHVNSNTPSEEYLIPTTLKLEAPTDIIIGKVTYPAGKDMSFAFAPDQKLNVYSGDFAISVLVRPLSSVLPGRYAVRGELRFQACDNAACYPPKKLPVGFDVTVAKTPPPPRKNPAQSPHVHN
jgi:Disulphide bond corrector protein DsbC